MSKETDLLKIIGKASKQFGPIVGAVPANDQGNYNIACLRYPNNLERGYMSIRAQAEGDTVHFYWGHYDLSFDTAINNIKA